MGLWGGVVGVVQGVGNGMRWVVVLGRGGSGNGGRWAGGGGTVFFLWWGWGGRCVGHGGGWCGWWWAGQGQINEQVLEGGTRLGWVTARGELPQRERWTCCCRCVEVVVCMSVSSYSQQGKVEK